MSFLLRFLSSCFAQTKLRVLVITPSIKDVFTLLPLFLLLFLPHTQHHSEISSTVNFAYLNMLQWFHQTWCSDVFTLANWHLVQLGCFVAESALELFAAWGNVALRLWIASSGVGVTGWADAELSVVVLTHRVQMTALSQHGCMVRTTSHLFDQNVKATTLRHSIKVAWISSVL